MFKDKTKKYSIQRKTRVILDKLTKPATRYQTGVTLYKEKYRKSQAQLQIKPL